MMNEPEHICDEWTSDKGERFKLTFYESDSPNGFSPIVQCYGLCFNEKGEIAIGRNPISQQGKWILPGGKPEKGETPEETLRREIMEELDLVAGKVLLLGGQKVEFVDEPSKMPVYQLRYAVIIKEVLPLTPDPDGDLLWERKFVKPSEINHYLKWGKIFEHLVEKSVEWYNSQ